MMEVILKGVPSEFSVALGSKEMAKEAWESLKTMRLGNNRVRKAKAQQLRREYEAITFHDGEAVEDFALRLTIMVSQLVSLGDAITEKEVVAKFLRVFPSCLAQIAMSIETLLEMSELTNKDIAGRLKAVEDRAVDAASHAPTGGQLLLTEEQWAVQARDRKTGEGPSVMSGGGSGGSGRGRSKMRRRRGGGSASGGGSAGGGGRASTKDKLWQDQALGLGLQSVAPPGAGAPHTRRGRQTRAPDGAGLRPQRC